jgi:CheY-like chemotaxis protein
MVILVLEDDPLVSAVIRLILQSSGHTLIEAATAEEALLRFEDNDCNVDLLIADVNLPVSSGIRVALELRSLLPHLRIIVTSGYPPAMWNEQDAAAFKKLTPESVAILLKPFLPATLLDKVARFIPMLAVQTRTASS